MVKLSISLVVIAIISFLIILFKVNLINKSFTTIQKPYNLSSFIQHQEGELIKGDLVAGRLRSFEDNLGIISIRFDTFDRVNNGLFTFRVKEEGGSGWYYENEYQSSKFGGYPLFPFGFPIIADAKGRVYYFELESLNGEPGNSIAIKMAEPVIATTHKFTVDQLLSDKKTLTSFVFQKAAELTINKQILQESLLFDIILSSIFVALVSRKRLVQFMSKSRKQLRVGKLKQLKGEQIAKVWLPVLNTLLFITSFVLLLLTLPPKWLKKE